MNAFRLTLALIFVTILIYTSVVIFEHGFDLFSVFFGSMTEMTWSGQFNVDFLCYLVLSALWVSWRHSFSIKGLLLGLLALVFGALFLSAYLLIESFKVNGSMTALLLGDESAKDE